MDKGYDSKAVRELVNHKDYIPHIRRIGEEKLDTEGEKHYARGMRVRIPPGFGNPMLVIGNKVGKRNPYLGPHCQPLCCQRNQEEFLVFTPT